MIMITELCREKTCLRVSSQVRHKMCQLGLLTHKDYKILHVETRGITKALIAAHTEIWL